MSDVGHRIALSLGLSLTLSLCTVGCQRDEADTRATAPTTSPVETGFNGVFHTSGDGPRSVLSLTHRNGTVTGMLDAAAITARVDGPIAAGEVRHPGTGANLGTVHLSLDQDLVNVTLVATDPQTGQALELPRKTYSRGAPPPIDIKLDAQLVGRWRQTWRAPGEGDQPDRVVHVWLMLNSDGTVQHGKRAPGDSVLLPVGVSDDGGLVGKWRTSEQTLHFRTSDHVQWVPLARYQVEGDALVLTYNDGNRQTYQRQ
jgi:hypothetical protein